MSPSPPPPLEVRLEIYVDGPLDPDLAKKITGVLSEKWPVTWDIKIPPRTSLEHPARWHAVVPCDEGQTPEGLHRELAQKVGALDPARRLRFRTRWDLPESPNEQEIYEVGWKPTGA